VPAIRAAIMTVHEGLMKNIRSHRDIFRIHPGISGFTFLLFSVFVVISFSVLLE
jgi:hypothetical protein